MIDNESQKKRIDKKWNEMPHPEKHGFLWWGVITIG